MDGYLGNYVKCRVGVAEEMGKHEKIFSQLSAFPFSEIEQLRPTKEKKRPKDIGHLTASDRRMLILAQTGSSRSGDPHHKEDAGAPRPNTRHKV